MRLQRSSCTLQPLTPALEQARAPLGALHFFIEPPERQRIRIMLRGQFIPLERLVAEFHRWLRFDVVRLQVDPAGGRRNRKGQDAQNQNFRRALC